MICIGRYNIAEPLQSGAGGQRGCYGAKLSRDKIETKQSYRWELIEKSGNDSLRPILFPPQRQRCTSPTSDEDIPLVMNNILLRCILDK
jgi:hypothetical protein